ncbi:MAG TPA: hypothetical protein PKY55_14735 [bacterium]|nr:hypothetical protein [bacterium]
MSTVKVTIRSIAVIYLFIALISCQREPNAPHSLPDTIANAINYTDRTLAVPDSIPAVVDEAALKRAQELMCSGIRLLLIEPEKSFLVSFFDPLTQDVTTEEGIVESRIVNFDYKNNRILSESIASTEIHSLAKSFSYNICWSLAQVFEDADYSGDSFLFSQETSTTGYYHKIIYNLAQSQSCCWYNYSGTLNDCLSSHQWSYHNEGTLYTMVPDNFKVWRDAQRSGPSHTFNAAGSGCIRECYDDNWIDEYWWDNGLSVTINDKVSSIDMSYWVVEYNNCP